MDEMSEEKPVFKVRDRRLFNPDGTPREVEGHEENERPATDSSAAATVATQTTDASATTAQADAPAEPAAASASQSAPGESRSSSQQQSAAQPAEESTQGFAGEDEELAGDMAGDMPGADDPASFVNFLMSIASNAAAALGMMEHPATGQRGVDLPLGKHWIDVLGMLHQKTEGNLLPQERQILEGILADLRMQYVSLTSAPRPPQGPRGFSGSDITGGR